MTTLLRGLEKSGYIVDICKEKPPPEARVAFCIQHFDYLVTRWARLTSHPGVLLIEESPWSYLAKHAVNLDARTRVVCNAALAPLVLPTLTISLHSSGRAVGRRHPLYHQEPDKYAPVAMDQMVQLQLLPHACYHVDATVSPMELVGRVKSLLESKVFKVLSADVDGMEHLTADLPPLPREACLALGKKLGLLEWSADTEEGIRRLTRLSAILE